MMRRQALWLGLIAGCGAAAAAAGLWLGNARVEPAAAADDAVARLFAHSFPDADGRLQAVAQWQGRLLVVNFWATWCPPCVEEMPDLQKIRDAYQGRGVEVIGIGIDTEAKIRDFRDRLGLTLPLLAAGFDGTGLAQALGNRAGALPYTVLVDRSGRVAQRKLGQVKPDELRQWLDAQLR